jgi:energy-coupling factor transporter transmembrane protein EcfT
VHIFPVSSFVYNRLSHIFGTFCGGLGVFLALYLCAFFTLLTSLHLLLSCSRSLLVDFALDQLTYRGVLWAHSSIMRLSVIILGNLGRCVFAGLARVCGVSSGGRS